jgi:hypothetical protein
MRGSPTDSASTELLVGGTRSLKMIAYAGESFWVPPFQLRQHLVLVIESVRIVAKRLQLNEGQASWERAIPERDHRVVRAFRHQELPSPQCGARVRARL